MAVSGSDLKVLFNVKTNSPYSQAIGDTKMSAIFNEALVKTVEDIYRKGDNDYTLDNVRSLVKTGVTAAVATNRITTASVTDLNHILAVKCYIQDATFKPLLTNVLLIDGTYTRIVLSKASALRSKEQVLLTGTPITGTYYVKQLNETVYELYTDVNLLVPAYNGVPYANAGTVSRVIGRYTMPYKSEDKNSSLATPTIYYPKHQETYLYVKLDAGGSTILSAELDYITNIAVPIDVTGVTDLLPIYPQELLYKITDRACEIFAELTRDQSLFQTSVTEIQQTK